LIAIFIRPLAGQADSVTAAVRQAAGELSRQIPVQLVFMSAADAVGAGPLPTYRDPEAAAHALGKAAGHAEWRTRPDARPPELPGLRPDEAAAILAGALASEREWLDAEECIGLLECYGIEMPEAIVAGDPEAAARAAAELGGAVALKAHGPQILHKSELGAVRTGLEGSAEVEHAATEMDEALARRDLGRASFLVQRLVEDGVELLVGVATDPVFGPVVACGAGGTAVELLGDVAVRVCPLGAADAAEMLRSLAIFPMLTGFRGQPPVDLDLLAELVLRVGALADTHREIVELDLNPVIATMSGALAVDARIRVAERPPARRPWPRTWS
jgi:acyl-CoA synthetase (NDP forming)